MPIYEYQCSECGKTFEVLQKINEDPVAECKFCSGKVEQLISHTSFQLKGGGWYVTDYAGRSVNSSSADSHKSADAAKTTENKSNTAPKSSESGSAGKAD